MTRLLLVDDDAQLRAGMSAYLRRLVAQPTISLRSSALAKTPDTIGDYRIVEEPGRGALGVGLRAEHRLLKKPVAIKLWSLPHTQTAKANAALLREAYDYLGLGDFDVVEPAIDAYLDQTRDYRTSRYEISADLRTQIESRWGPYVRRYGYLLKPISVPQLAASQA